MVKKGLRKPKRLTASIEKIGDLLVIRCRQRDWASGGFLVLWLSGWTVGCIFLFGMVMADPKIFNFLFAVPFWASWIFVFCILLNSFLRIESFSLDRNGASIDRRVLVTLHQRSVPLKEIHSFQSYSELTDSENNRYEEGIEARTTGKPLRFGDRLPKGEREWLRQQLNDHLSELREGRVVQFDPPLVESESSKTLGHPAVEKLSVSRNSLQPPSDCRWKRIDDFDQIQFFQRGRFSFGTVAGLLFINAFWNGIVSVFVFGGLFNVIDLPDGQNNDMAGGFGWWFLFLFLIPFEIVGLLMFIGLLGAIFNPFRTTIWSFTRSSIDSRLSWFGIGRRRSHYVTLLDRVELRKGDADKKKPRRSSMRIKTNMQSADEDPFTLAFIESDDHELCRIDDLTEGEARWIADTLLRERGRWFE